MWLVEVTIVGLSYDRAVAELENWMSKWSGVELSELRDTFLVEGSRRVYALVGVFPGLVWIRSLWARDNFSA